MRRSLMILLLAAAIPVVITGQSSPRGVQLFNAHDRAGARAEFEIALKRNSKDASAHFYLGRLALIDNDVDAAAEHLERAVKLADNVADYHYWYGAAVAQQGSRASKVKMPFLARRTMGAVERAVALDPNHVDARDLLVDFYSMAPAIMGGGIDKAHAQASALAARNPMRGHVARGRIAIAAKDGPTVERELNSAIDLAPDSLRAYSSLASWYVRQKQWPHAFAVLDRYLSRRPDDLHGQYQIGRIAALSAQQLARGEQGLRAFIANPPRDAAAPSVSLAYFRLGQVLEHQGKHAEGRAAIEQAVKLDPRNESAKAALK